MNDEMQRQDRGCSGFVAILGAAIVGICASISWGQTQYFALKPGDGRDVSDTDLKRPTVGGLTIRVPWSVLNPRPGVYNFDVIDRNIAQAQRCGNKPLKLIVQTGRGGASPNWFGGLTYQGAPLPWSAEMLVAYDTLMQELGRKYRYRFYAAHITGPSFPSAEMHPAPNIERVKGYSDQKMIDAWTTAAKSVATAFPGAALPLSISVQKPASRYVDATINKIRTNVGSRLILQHNALKANTDVTAPHHRLLLKYRTFGVRIAFEMACSATDDPSRFGSKDVMQGVKLGREAGAEFIDVYPPDLGGLR